MKVDGEKIGADMSRAMEEAKADGASALSACLVMLKAFADDDSMPSDARLSLLMLRGLVTAAEVELCMLRDKARSAIQ